MESLYLSDISCSFNDEIGLTTSEDASSCVGVLYLILHLWGYLLNALDITKEVIEEE